MPLNFKSQSGNKQLKASKFGGSSGGGGIEKAAGILLLKEMMEKQQEKRKPGLESEVQTAQQKSKIANRELSVDERADLQVFDTIHNYVNEMEGLMNTDPEGFRSSFIKANLPFDRVTTLGDQKAINMNRSLHDWADLILRARSKSQTTEKEFGRIRSFGVPRLEDITVEKDPTTGDSYPTIRKMFSNVRNITENNRQRIIQGIGFENRDVSSPIPGMTSGVSKSDKRSQYNSLREQGLSQAEARKRVGL